MLAWDPPAPGERWPRLFWVDPAPRARDGTRLGVQPLPCAYHRFARHPHLHLHLLHPPSTLLHLPPPQTRAPCHRVHFRFDRGRACIIWHRSRVASTNPEPLRAPSRAQVGARLTQRKSHAMRMLTVLVLVRWGAGWACVGSAVPFENQLIVFGGVHQRAPIGQLAVLNTTSWLWTLPATDHVEPPRGEAPSPRFCHSATLMWREADRCEMVVLGGTIDGHDLLRCVVGRPTQPHDHWRHAQS